jgi:hypothetical protein
MRIEFAAADDDVVEEGDVHCGGGVAQRARDADVLGARAGVAAGVIVLCCVPSYVK